MLLSFNKFSPYFILLICILEEIDYLDIAVLIELKNDFYMKCELQKHNH